MTQSPQRGVSTGWDEQAAKESLGIGFMTDALEFPWRLASKIVAFDRPSTAEVLDIAAGPGGFLAAALSELPEASGIWFDFSQTMLAEAEGNLAQYSGRVEFRTGDLLELDATVPETDLDFVATSRGTHHVRDIDLPRFYAQVFGRLRPGGWLANLDILGAPRSWDERIREVRRALRPPDLPAPAPANHPHLFPRPLLEDHLAAIESAGFVETRIVWTSFFDALSLLMARKPTANP